MNAAPVLVQRLVIHTVAAISSSSPPTWPSPLDLVVAVETVKCGGGGGSGRLWWWKQKLGGGGGGVGSVVPALVAVWLGSDDGVGSEEADGALGPSSSLFLSFFFCLPCACANSRQWLALRHLFPSSQTPFSFFTVRCEKRRRLRLHYLFLPSAVKNARLHYLFYHPL
jgi:hypothetical protein